MALTKTGSQRMVKGIGNGVLALMFLWTAIPFYWMFVTSLKHDKEIYGYEATLIPERPTMANYVTILKDSPYLLFLRNSTVVAVCSTILSIIIASLGAYAIARLNFPGRAMLARLLVCTYLVPASLLFIPLFALMSMFHLLDSLSGLTIVYLGADVPFCTWLLMGYFRSVPVELEEAALVDGCNRITALIRIVLPVCAAGRGGGDVLLVHPCLERVSVCLRVHQHQSGQNDHHGAGQLHECGRVLLGTVDGLDDPQRPAPGHHVSPPPALGGEGADAGGGQRIARGDGVC